MTPVSRNTLYKVYADIRGGSLGWGHQTTVGLLTTANFQQFWSLLLQKF